MKNLVATIRAMGNVDLRREVLVRAYCRCLHRGYDHADDGCDLCPCEMMDEIPWRDIQGALRTLRQESRI